MRHGKSRQLTKDPAMLTCENIVHEECGSFGPHARQRHGQEAGGIVDRAPGQDLHTIRSRGLMRDNHTTAKMIEDAPGTAAFGQGRRAKVGPAVKTAVRDAQPLFGAFVVGSPAHTKTGMTNPAALRRQGIGCGTIYQSGSDDACRFPRGTPSKALRLQDLPFDTFSRVEGAVSADALTGVCLSGTRAPCGLGLHRQSRHALKPDRASRNHSPADTIAGPGRTVSPSSRPTGFAAPWRRPPAALLPDPALAASFTGDAPLAIPA